MCVFIQHAFTALNLLSVSLTSDAPEHGASLVFAVNEIISKQTVSSCVSTIEESWWDVCMRFVSEI